MKNWKTIAAAVVILIALGVGVLVYASAPDSVPAQLLEPTVSVSVPEDALEPATPAPTTTPTPAPSTENGDAWETCKACKAICALNPVDCAACLLAHNCGGEAEAGYSGVGSDVAPCLVAALVAAGRDVDEAIAEIENLPADQRTAWDNDGIPQKLVDVKTSITGALEGRESAEGATCGAYAAITAVLETGFPAEGTPIATALTNALVSLSDTGYGCAQP